MAEETDAPLAEFDGVIGEKSLNEHLNSLKEAKANLRKQNADDASASSSSKKSSNKKRDIKEQDKLESRDTVMSSEISD